MNCDSCKTDQPKVSFFPGKKWVAICNYCQARPVTKGYTKVMVGNKHYPKMSYAMQQRIKTRRLRSDGKVRPDAQWR